MAFYCFKCDFKSDSLVGIRRHVWAKHKIKTSKDYKEGTTQDQSNGGYTKKRRKTKQKKHRRKNTAGRKRQSGPVVQEIIIPIYLRIPLALGQLSIIEPMKGKDNE